MMGFDVEDDLGVPEADTLAVEPEILVGEGDTLVLELEILAAEIEVLVVEVVEFVLAEDAFREPSIISGVDAAGIMEVKLDALMASRTESWAGAAFVVLEAAVGAGDLDRDLLLLLSEM